MGYTAGGSGGPSFIFNFTDIENLMAGSNIGIPGEYLYDVSRSVVEDK